MLLMPKAGKYKWLSSLRVPKAGKYKSLSSLRVLVHIESVYPKSIYIYNKTIKLNSVLVGYGETSTVKS